RLEERDEALRFPERVEEATLALEARAHVGRDADEDLDRHVSPLGRAGAEDDARAASPDLRERLVSADPHADMIAARALEGKADATARWPSDESSRSRRSCVHPSYRDFWHGCSAGTQEE